MWLAPISCTSCYESIAHDYCGDLAGGIVQRKLATYMGGFYCRFPVGIRAITFAWDSCQSSQAFAVNSLAEGGIMDISAGPAVFSEHG